MNRFYIFGLSNSAVYQPVTNPDAWTVLTPFPASISRKEGATAVRYNSTPVSVSTTTPL